MTDSGYIGHSQFQDFQRAIEGNHKNHMTAKRNARSRNDYEDMKETDRHFAAASHFAYEMHQCPKNLLMYIKIAKYLNQRNVHVIFVSSAQITWSRSLRAWRGGFLQIRPEIMTNEYLEDFRKDFGLDYNRHGEEPMVMQILGDTKLYMATHRYSLGKDGTISTNSPVTPENMNETEQKFYNSVYKQADYMTDNLDLLVLQNDDREPVLEVLVKTEGNTLLADLQNALGQVQPNWQSDRLRYTIDGDVLYKKDDSGRILYDQPLKSKPGLPKTNLPIYHPQERAHMINVFSHMETEDETKTEIHARIMKPKSAGQRAKLWQRRKDQIKYHLKEDTEVQKQLEKEQQAFLRKVFIVKILINNTP